MLINYFILYLYIQKRKAMFYFDTYEYRKKLKVIEFNNFIDSLSYRNHDYLKNNIDEFSIHQIDYLMSLILA